MVEVDDDAVDRNLVDELDAWVSVPVALAEEEVEDDVELDPSEEASWSTTWSNFSASGVECRFIDFWANFLAFG